MDSLLQKRGVSIALGKNSQTFHRLASGDFGLVAWYPNIKEKKVKNGEAAKADQPAGPGPTTVAEAPPIAAAEQTHKP